MADIISKERFINALRFMRQRIRKERREKRLVLGTLKGLVNSAKTPQGSPERARAIKNAIAVIERFTYKETK